MGATFCEEAWASFQAGITFIHIDLMQNFYPRSALNARISASKRFYHAAIEEARTSCTITIASRDYLTAYINFR